MFAYYKLITTCFSRIRIIRVGSSTHITPTSLLSALSKPRKMKKEPAFVTINGAKYTYFHLAIYLITFFAYALFHASRKTFSNIKTTVSDNWRASCDLDDKYHNCTEFKPDSVWNTHRFFGTESEAKIFLGTLDSIFLSAYAIGLFISGMLGDRFNLRYVLTLGMTLSAVSIFMFGVVSEWLTVYNKFYYIVFWIINGFLQSTGWPAVVAVMGNWFGKSGRGLIFSVWASTANAGNVLGALMVASVLKYGYEYAILFTSGSLFAGGIVVFFGLVTCPQEIGLPDPDAPDPTRQPLRQGVYDGQDQDGDQSENIIISSNDGGDDDEDDDDDENDICPVVADTTSLNDNGNGKKNDTGSGGSPVGFWQALMLPGVLMYSLCYACLKMVNYSFLFWLPFYLTSKFHWSEAKSDEISIWYDVGSVFGGILGGLASDVLRGKRSVVITSMLTLSIPMLFLFSDSTNDMLLNATLLWIVGFFIGGAAIIISGTITADLGRHESLQGNKEGLATVAGIVDGTGSVGAALGQILVPLIQNEYSWVFVFYFFIALCVATNLCILPLFFREMRELYFNFRHRGAARVSNNGYSRINTSDRDEKEC